MSTTDRTDSQMGYGAGLWGKVTVPVVRPNAFGWIVAVVPCIALVAVGVQAAEPMEVVLLMGFLGALAGTLLVHSLSRGAQT